MKFSFLKRCYADANISLSYGLGSKDIFGKIELDCFQKK